MSADAAAPAILVVEDEFLVRLFAVDALEDAGFRVIQAGTAAEAMQALRAAADVRAALVDVGLPDRPAISWRPKSMHCAPICRSSSPAGAAGGSCASGLPAIRAITILVKPYTAPLLLEVLANVGAAATCSAATYVRWCDSTRPVDSRA